MDRKFMQKPSKKQLSTPSFHPTHLTHVDPTLANQNPQLHTIFQESAKTITENSNH